MKCLLIADESRDEAALGVEQGVGGRQLVARLNELAFENCWSATRAGGWRFVEIHSMSSTAPPVATARCSG